MDDVIAAVVVDGLAACTWHVVQRCVGALPCRLC